MYICEVNGRKKILFSHSNGIYSDDMVQNWKTIKLVGIKATEKEKNKTFA